jgi:tetratricopeptide (TPR) repeat protein
MADRQQESFGEKTENGGTPGTAQKVIHSPLDPLTHDLTAGNCFGLVDRVNSLLELGARESEVQNPVASRQAFRDAAQIARSLRRPDLLAKAALGMGKILAGAGPGIVDHQLISVFEEALAAIGPSESQDRAILLARLAVDVYWSRDRNRALQLGREAVEIARRLGDTATLIAVLNLRQCMHWGPANLEQRLATATEMVSIARDIGDWEALLSAHRARLGAMLEMGEIHEVDAEIAAIENVARSIGTSTGYVERFRVMRALMRGEFDDAERWLDRLLVVAQQRDDRQLLFTYTGQLGVLLGERGRAPELSPRLSGTSSEIPQLPVVRMAMALLYARTNRIAQARAEFEYLAADDFAEIPDDWNWLGTLAHLAEVCVRIGDLERAPILYRLLAPYAGRSATLGYGDVYYNCISHYLALISTAVGEFDRARREFESSLRFNRRMGAGVALAYTEAAYASMLVKCQGSDENQHAVELLRRAREAGEGFGLKALLTEIARAAGDGDVQAANDFVPAMHLKVTATFRCEGDVWTLSWGKDTVRVRNLKGLQAIAHLLAHPGQEIHIAELSEILDRNVRESDGARGNSSHGIAAISADTGPLLDGEAKQAYRTRLRDLRLELAEAETMNDVGRSDGISAEIQFLEAELVRAIGLGGRDRRGASVSERSRVRVTNAIRSAIARVGENQPAIGHHLRVSIRTGTCCSYSPDPSVAPKWRL